MQPALENIKVLVVDDEAPARQRLLDLLHRDAQVGTILEACNGEDAIELIEEHHPALVLQLVEHFLRCHVAPFAVRDRDLKNVAR